MSLKKKDKVEFENFLQLLKEKKRTFVGYPVNTTFDYSEISDFLEYPINNVGDPFDSSYYGINSKKFEVKVLDWFAKLYKAPPDNYWGYVTNGGTEGNMYGLYLARELYPKGVVYYSQDTHYSVSKNIRMLGMDHVMIKSRRNGEMDYDDLKHMVATWRSAPPIIFANMGTTMKEGFDDIFKIKEILKQLAIPEYYVHVDAAMSGMTLPFIDGAPFYTFVDGIQSVSISGHKFIGSPVPCGVVLALKSNVGRVVSREIEYVGSLDSTVSGSRNGYTPILLWYTIKDKGFNGFKKAVRTCLRTAERAVKKFNENNIKAWKNDYAITIVFPQPSDFVVEKWQLAIQDGHSHMLAMPQVTDELIDELIDDILNK
jgi:histidine decarboxylase